MSREDEIYRVTIAGGAVNVGLMLFKFMAGLLGHSAAMLADAVHSLSDLATDLVLLLFVRVAGKPQDLDHDYGHGKFETLASLVIGVALLAVGLGMAIEGIHAIAGCWRGAIPERPTAIALAAAIISLPCKEALYHYTRRAAKRLDSPALEANAWHHRSDALTSLTAFAGIACAMLLEPRWRVLDPLAAVIVSLFILWMAWTLVRPCLDELLEKSLPKEEKDRITEIVAHTPGVVAFHRLRTRRIGSRRAVEVHIKMPGENSLTEAHNVASAIEKRLREEFGPNAHVAIHMEPL